MARRAHVGGPRWSVCLLLLLALLVAACGAEDGAGSARSTTSTLVTTTTSTTTTAPSTTTTQPSTTTQPATTTTVPPGSSAGGLQLGARGPAVTALQGRLVELGYWLGVVDGVFGPGTLHAVVALQKAAGLARDGVVGRATMDALEVGTRPVAASTAGHVVEIDLARQLILVVDDGAVTAVFDTSTGRVAGTTPAGHWTIEREIDGYRRSPLGLLYRPKYFHEGVAIHGYTSVPSQPASHGCVRVTYPAMDHIWASGLMPIGTPVWVR